MNKLFLYLASFLLILINLNLYAPAVTKSKQESVKDEKRAIELIEQIAKNAVQKIPPTEDEIYELKSLSPSIAGSKKYDALIAELNKIPAKKQPTDEKEKNIKKKYSNVKLKKEDVK